MFRVVWNFGPFFFLSIGLVVTFDAFLGGDLAGGLHFKAVHHRGLLGVVVALTLVVLFGFIRGWLSWEDYLNLGQHYYAGPKWRSPLWEILTIHWGLAAAAVEIQCHFSKLVDRPIETLIFVSVFSIFGLLVMLVEITYLSPYVENLGLFEEHPSLSWALTAGSWWIVGGLILVLVSWLSDTQNFWLVLDVGLPFFRLLGLVTYGVATFASLKE